MDNKTYCILCGKENNPASKFCVECGQPLDQKDDDVLAYVKEKAQKEIKETAKEKAEKSFLSLLKKLVNSYLYGIIMSITIVAAAANIITDGTSADVVEFNNDDGLFSQSDMDYTTDPADTTVMKLSGYSRYMVNTDETGNITEGFIELYAFDYGLDAKIAIYDANGNVLVDTDDKIMDKWYKIPASAAKIEITEPNYTTMDKTTITFYPNKQVKELQLHRDADLYEHSFYNEDGVKTRQYTVDAIHDGIAYGSYWIMDENGQIISSTEYENDIPIRKYTIDQGDNYKYTYHFTFDENKNEIPGIYEIEEYNEHGSPLRTGWMYPDGTMKNVTVYTYYESNAVRTVEIYEENSLTFKGECEENGAGTEYYYDENGSLERIRESDESGAETNYYYNEAGTVYRIIKRDANGDIISREEFD